MFGHLIIVVVCCCCWLMHGSICIINTKYHKRFICFCRRRLEKYNAIKQFSYFFHHLLLLHLQITSNICIRRVGLFSLFLFKCYNLFQINWFSVFFFYLSFIHIFSFNLYVAFESVYNYIAYAGQSIVATDFSSYANKKKKNIQQLINDGAFYYYFFVCNYFRFS